jgi:hypothetical protein
MLLPLASGESIRRQSRSPVIKTRMTDPEEIATRI